MDMFATPLKDIPSDKSSISEEDEHIIYNLFADGKKMASKGMIIINQLREVLVAGILYIILSLTFMDGFLISKIPSCNSKIILIFVKSLIFMVLFYIIKNWNLTRKE